MTDGAALPAPAVLADARLLPLPDASVDRVTSHAGVVYTRLARHRLTRPLAVANIWVHAVRP